MRKVWESTSLPCLFRGSLWPVLPSESRLPSHGCVLHTQPLERIKKPGTVSFWESACPSLPLFFFLFFFYQKAAFLSEQILKEPRTFSLLRILSFSFPLSALHSCINSFFYSKKKTGLPAVILLLEQMARIGATYVLYLIFLSEKREITASIAAGGALFGELVACCVSLFALGLDFSRKLIIIFLKSAKSASFSGKYRKSQFQAVLTGLTAVFPVHGAAFWIPQRLQLTGMSASQALGILTESLPWYGPSAASFSCHSPQFPFCDAHPLCGRHAGSWKVINGFAV